MSDEEVTDQAAVEVVQQRTIQHMLNGAQFAMGSMAYDLKCGLPRASTLVLSCMGTAVMAFIRGYPRETWVMQFREIGEYFTRMADEEEAKTAEAAAAVGTAPQKVELTQ